MAAQASSSEVSEQALSSSNGSMSLLIRLMRQRLQGGSWLLKHPPLIHLMRQRLQGGSGLLKHPPEASRDTGVSQPADNEICPMKIA